MNIFDAMAILAGLILSAGALMYLLLRLVGEGREGE